MSRSKKLTLALLLLSISSSLTVAQQEEVKNAQSLLHFQSGVVVEGDLLAVDKEGHLIRLNATWGGKRDFGNFDRELNPDVAVAGRKAYVSTSSEVCEINLESGALERTAKHSLGNARVGVIDEERVFVQNGDKVEVISLQSGETIHSLDLGETSRNRLLKSTTMPHVLDGDILYIALSEGGVIAAVDVNSGELVRRIVMDFHWVTGMHIAGEKLYASQLTSSYGIIHESLVAYDLTSLQPSRIELPGARGEARNRLQREDQSYSPIAMVSQTDGGFCLSVKQGVYQFDNQGRVVAKSAALQPGQRLIAATTYEVILSTSAGYDTNELSDIDTSVK